MSGTFRCTLWLVARHEAVRVRRTHCGPHALRGAVRRHLWPESMHGSPRVLVVSISSPHFQCQDATKCYSITTIHVPAMRISAAPRRLVAMDLKQLHCFVGLENLASCKNGQSCEQSDPGHGE